MNTIYSNEKNNKKRIKRVIAFKTIAFLFLFFKLSLKDKETIINAKIITI